MIDGMLSSSDGIGLVEAFDPGTGKTNWVQEVDGPEQMRAGGSSRRISYWRNANDARIFSVRGEYLYALDPKTGQLIRSFGENGRVGLRAGLGPLATGFAATSG